MLERFFWTLNGSKIVLLDGECTAEGLRVNYDTLRLRANNVNYVRNVTYVDNE